MAAPVTRHAHAKLNLALWVGPALPPDNARAGFHPVCSWMSAIDLSDEVTAEPAERATFSLSWAPDAPRPTPIDWTPDQDLAARALRLLEQRVGRSLPARLRVLKRIPVGSGLGGGSSDAAAALMALNEAFALGVSNPDLVALAARLGSDVPFFVDHPHDPPRPAIISGLGERVERIARIPGDVLIIIPPFSCATGPVYRAFDELEDQRSATARAAGGAPAVLRGEPEDDALVRARAAKALELGRVEGRSLFNALTPAAARVEPRVQDLIATIANVTNYHTRLTGSGSAVFLPVEPGRVDRTLERLGRAVAAAEAGEAGARPVLVGCRVVRTRFA